MTGLRTLRLKAGDGPRATLVALPGLMESTEALLPTLGHWACRGFDILGIDPRGHAGSARWTGALLDRHPGDVMVEDILATLEETSVDPLSPIVLFGHSGGGAAAAAVAAALSRRVRAVVLEDPFWRLPVTQFQDLAAADGASAELQRKKALSPAQRIDEIKAIFPQWPADELAAWSRAKDDMDLPLVANGHIIPARGWPTLMADLAQAGIPVLVVTGTIRTGMTTNHRAILRALGAEVVVVRGATHFIRRDARDLFHKLTDAFLDRHVPTKGSNGAVREAAASGIFDNLLRVTPRDLQNLGGPSWPK